MKRIEWVDISKGIAILTVIVGHTIGNAFIRGPIFSFHMPLFFILSGYTMRYSADIKELKKRDFSLAVKMLFIAYGMFLLHRTIQFFIEKNPLTVVPQYLKDTVYAVFWSSGTAFSAFGNEYLKIGMMWFLVVFALARCIYDFIHMKYKNIMGGGITLICTLFGMYIVKETYLPLSFDIVLTAVPFYCFGCCLKENKFLSVEKTQLFKTELQWFFITGCVWFALYVLIYYFTGTYFEYAKRIYPLGLICFICAGAGCTAVFYFAKMTERVSSASRLLSWLGRNSLTILCVHYFDDFWKFIWHYGNGLIEAVIRCLIDLLIVILILNVKKILIGFKNYECN